MTHGLDMSVEVSVLGVAADGANDHGADAHVEARGDESIDDRLGRLAPADAQAGREDLAEGADLDDAAATGEREKRRRLVDIEAELSIGVVLDDHDAGGGADFEEPVAAL